MAKLKKNPLSMEDDKKTGETLCVVGKGGAGKSTISANLGLALSRRGIKTVVVDADIEDANLGLIYGLGFDVPTIQDYLSGKVTVEDTIFRVRGQVDLVPGSVRVESLSRVTLDLFQDFITQMAEKYKIVLVDAPAGLGVDLLTVASACENMIVVVTPVITSVAYAIKLKMVAEKLENNILGIVVNRAGRAYDIPRKHIEDITGLDVIVEVEEDEEVLRSMAKGELLLFHRPKVPASLSIKRLARKIPKRLNL
jgi:septum site-determining protein MinD